MVIPSEPRELAVWYLTQFEQTPYGWGGQGPLRFDCSGVLVEVLRGAGVIPAWQDLNSQGLIQRFRATKGLEPGRIVGYGKSPGDVSHVMMAINDWYVMGATGGDSETRTNEEAEADEAFVKVRPWDYRSDVVAVVDPFIDFER